MALGERILEPEWLDLLEPADPRASRARRDLKLVNAIMGNGGILRRALERSLGNATRIAEIGAGDGTLMLRLARSMRRRGIEVTLVDRAAAVDERTLEGFRSAGWKAGAVVSDAIDWLERPGTCDVLVANLFLHHFEGAQLRRLLAAAAERTHLFIACEPRRSGIALSGARMLGALGCSPDTVHDAVVSVRAGFRAHELSLAWGARPGWSIEEGPRGVFSHLFVAHRHD